MKVGRTSATPGSQFSMAAPFISTESKLSVFCVVKKSFWQYCAASIRTHVVFVLSHTNYRVVCYCNNTASDNNSHDHLSFSVLRPEHCQLVRDVISWLQIAASAPSHWWSEVCRIPIRSLGDWAEAFQDGKYINYSPTRRSHKSDLVISSSQSCHSFPLTGCADPKHEVFAPCQGEAASAVHLNSGR